MKRINSFRCPKCGHQRLGMTYDCGWAYPYSTGGTPWIQCQVFDDPSVYTFVYKCADCGAVYAHDEFIKMLEDHYGEFFS